VWRGVKTGSLIGGFKGPSHIGDPKIRGPAKTGVYGFRGPLIGGF